MRFPYRQLRIQRTNGTAGPEYRYRPTVPVLVTGPRGRFGLNALVDTGADLTLLPLALADHLGLDVDRSREFPITGVGGQQIMTYPGLAHLLLTDGSDAYEWMADVRFAESQRADVLLGHLGCLDYFTATFFGDLHELDIAPNDSFSSVSIDTQ